MDIASFILIHGQPLGFALMATSATLTLGCWFLELSGTKGRYH